MGLQTEVFLIFAALQVMPTILWDMVEITHMLVYDLMLVTQDGMGCRDCY